MKQFTIILICLFIFSFQTQQRIVKVVNVISPKVKDSCNKYYSMGYKLIQMQPLTNYTDGRTCGGAMDYANDYLIGVDTYILIFEK